MGPRRTAGGAIPVRTVTFKPLARQWGNVPISAVGFDLDYTLVVPARERAALLDEAVDAVGAEPIGRDAYLEAHREHLTGETRAPIFEALLSGGNGEDRGDRGSRAEELAETYRRVINESIVPLEGVESMLADLHDRYRVGLLTNGPVRAQRSKLETLGWTDAFDAVVVSGELEAGKPDPEPFEELCSALQTDPEETAYVGDDVEADVGGAKAAGLAVVQVCHEGGPDRDPRADAHVDWDEMVERLPGILETLRR